MGFGQVEAANDSKGTISHDSPLDFAGRLLRTFLFGVTSQDPAVLAGCVALLTALSTLACVVPGWRASRIDPAKALRVD